MISKDEVIRQLTDKAYSYIVLSVFSGALLTAIPSFLMTMGIGETLLFIAYLGAISGLLMPLASREKIKDFILTRIDDFELRGIRDFELTRKNDFEQLSLANQKVSDLDKENNLLRQTSQSQMREEQLLINLVRLYEVAPNDLILEIIMNDPALHKRWKIFNDTNVLLSDVKEKCTNWESRKNLGAIIRTIKKDSWKGLATSAALHALEPNLNDTNKLAYDKPEYLLFQDIYIYLYAWLVNSIDNSMTIDILYMPIEDIGLRYRSKQSPDIDKYKKAFKFLVNAFDTGDFYIGVESIQSLSQEQIKICKKGVPLYLNKLIEMLNDFEPRSRESLSIEEQP